MYELAPRKAGRGGGSGASRKKAWKANLPSVTVRRAVGWGREQVGMRPERLEAVVHLHV